MGQVDFSQLPLFFFDRVAIHPGGESALYGNGAIGGGILLSSRPSFEAKNFSLTLQETAGSFGYSFSGIKMSIGTERFHSKTALFYNRADNDFPFSYRDQKEKQKNAAYHNYGLLEEFDFRLKKDQQIGVKCWHTFFHREIQPSMQNNNVPQQYEQIEDRTTRILTDYIWFAPVTLNAKAAWVNDRQTYKRDLIATHDFTVDLNTEKTFRNVLFREINIKGGANTQYILPEVYSYKAGVDEWRTSFFLFSRFLLLQPWDITLNLRQNFVSGLRVPFTPSLGSAFRFLDNDRNQWSVRGNISHNFKVPTLNDRYWGNMDNRYLLPENGFNMEGGSNYMLRFSPYSLTIDATFYRNNVNNWIMWMPYGNIWKPQNIDKVEAKGVEINCKQTLTLAHSEYFLLFNYTYNHTEVKKGFEEMRPFVGRQMPLLPEHTLSVTGQIRINRLSFLLQGSYTGQRSTSDVNDLMPAYWVVNANMGYHFLFRKHSFNTSLQINNLLDTDYQNMPFKAMPGRHFYFSLIYEFNRQKI